jgi:hypothetical protein
MEEFNKIIKDFIRDLLNTFPELESKLTIELSNIHHDSSSDEDFKTIYQYIKEHYTTLFFDILYQNVEIFNKEIFLLPNIDFSLLWTENISDKTRAIIWKYIQLLSICVVYDTKDGNEFGNISELLKSMNQDDLKSKLDDLFGNMDEFMKDSETKPNAEDFHSHLNGLLDGKLGSLAKEIVDETSDDFKEVLNINENMDMKDIFNQVTKNPTKLMGLANKINSKIETKLKNGDMKESEIMEEAKELLQKMENIPGMDKIGQLLKKFGGKMDMKGMQNKMNQNINQAKTKERMQNKLQKKQSEVKPDIKDIPIQKSVDELYESIFSTGEVVEKTLKKNITENKKKIKKGKNKK